MPTPIDLERLSEVFTDHPWLAEAISNGAWWGNGDGSVQVVAPLEDPVAVRAGLTAFVEALGCGSGDIVDGAAAAHRVRMLQLSIPGIPGARRSPRH